MGRIQIVISRALLTSILTVSGRLVNRDIHSRRRREANRGMASWGGRAELWHWCTHGSSAWQM